jgi:tetraacyldisaccharide 4'-kinase
MNARLLELWTTSKAKKNCLIESVLYGFSLLFQGVCFIRHFLYDYGVLSSVHAKCLVVSVGNIAVGGTGKTPFVQKLVQELSFDPGKIAIVSRGYRSKLEKGGGERISSGSGPIQPVHLAGDEAFMLSKNTKASVWVGKKRFISIERACMQGSSLIILEDGFQHRKVARDFEIVLLDAKDLWGKGYFLPRGLLRDFPSRLKKADWIAVTRIGKEEDKEKIIQSIRRYTNAPVMGFSPSYQLDEAVKKKKVGAFCGIANPSFFYEALRGLGVFVVDTLTSIDHKLPSQAEIEQFALSCKAQGAEALVCTEKDFVKITKLQVSSLPIFALKMDFVCVWNENVWQEMKQTIHTRCNTIRNTS